MPLPVPGGFPAYFMRVETCRAPLIASSNGDRSMMLFNTIRKGLANTCPSLGPGRPSFQTTAIAGENTETSKWIGIYLGFGETVMDTAIAVAGQSGYFKRQR